MSACRGCGAEVIFMPSGKSGKPMILEAKPKKGVVLGVLDGAGAFGFTQGDDLQARARVVDVYTDHHATCPKPSG